MNGLVYCPPGGGKTVNATLVRADKRKKNLLICTDNSSIVLGNFDRPNLTKVNVSTVAEFVKAYEDAVAGKKYDNIIVDNLSDLFDMWILEMDASGKFKDMRQAYQIVYQEIKRMTRRSGAIDTNTIFTAWSDNIEVTLPTGEKVQRLQPKLPAKIIDNVCGLMNVVAVVTSGEKDGTKFWWYVTEPSERVIAKDQILCRKFCKPEDIFGEVANADK